MAALILRVRSCEDVAKRRRCTIKNPAIEPSTKNYPPKLNLYFINNYDL